MPANLSWYGSYVPITAWVPNRAFPRLTIIRGDDTDIFLPVMTNDALAHFDQTGYNLVPVNLTGALFIFVVAQSRPPYASVIKKTLTTTTINPTGLAPQAPTTDNPIQIVDALNGKLVIHLAAADTTLIPTGVYGVALKMNLAGKIVTVAKSILVLEDAATVPGGFS
jgi:hypothetical protein